MRFLCYTLGDESVPMPPPTAEQMAEMQRFVEEVTRSGALVATGGMAPTSEGVRVSYDGHKVTVTDGPFAEAKELIGGWALIDVPSKAEAIELTTRFLRVAGGGESRVRQVYGPGDLPAQLRAIQEAAHS